MIAITNFWELEDTHPAAFNAIYATISGDAYPRKDIDEAMSDQDASLAYVDMSDYTYRPVVIETAAKEIEARHSVKLSKAPVRRLFRRLYELT